MTFPVPEAGCAKPSQQPLTDMFVGRARPRTLTMGCPTPKIAGQRLEFSAQSYLLHARYCSLAYLPFVYGAFSCGLVCLFIYLLELCEVFSLPSHPK